MPDLPIKQVSRLKKTITSIAVKVKKEGMKLEQVNEVRRAFFSFFMEPLRDFLKFLKIQKQPAAKTDFESLFNIRDFIREFEMCCTDQELRFYKLFTSMTLFTRLVERAALRLNKEDQNLLRQLEKYKDGH